MGVCLYKVKANSFALNGKCRGELFAVGSRSKRARLLSGAQVAFLRNKRLKSRTLHLIRPALSAAGYDGNGNEQRRAIMIIKPSMPSLQLQKEGGRNGALTDLQAILQDEEKGDPFLF
jgi:hypothetical protein